MCGSISLHAAHGDPEKTGRGDEHRASGSGSLGPPLRPAPIIAGPARFARLFEAGADGHGTTGLRDTSCLRRMNEHLPKGVLFGPQCSLSWHSRSNRTPLGRFCVFMLLSCVADNRSLEPPPSRPPRRRPHEAERNGVFGVKRAGAGAEGDGTEGANPRSRTQRPGSHLRVFSLSHEFSRGKKSL